MFLIGGLLLKVASVVFSFLTNKSSDQKEIAIASLNAAVEAHKTASQERQTLLWPWVFNLFFLCTAGVCGMWFAAIMLDTMFTGIHWGIPSPPPPLNTMAIDIIKTVLGVGIPSGIAGATALGVARIFGRK
jgi:hypothetical protein